MKSFTPTTSFSNSRILLASLLTCIMLVAPLTPIGFAATNSSRLIQAKAKSTAKQPSAPKTDAPANAAARQQNDQPEPKQVVGITASKTDNRTAAQPVGPTNTINYTVTITNAGPDAATGVVLTDLIDANTTLVPNSIQSTPLANPDAFNVIGNVRIQPSAAQGLLANDFNPDNGNNTGLGASGPTTSAQGGNLTISADGSFSYNPAPGFTGTDTFTYTVTNTTTNKTDTSTVTLTVNSGTATPGPNVIWFIDNGNAATPRDGRLTNPFNSIAEFNANAADEVGDIIFIYRGNLTSYVGPLVLLNNQQLIGQAVDLATVTGITVPPYSNPLPGVVGAPPITSAATAGSDTVTLNSTGATGANTIRGVMLANAVDSDIEGTNFGTLTVSDTTLNGTGRALNLATGTLAATFLSITSTASPAQGVSLSSIGGSLTSAGGTTISGNPAQCILVSGSSVTANFGNTSCTGGTDGISLQNNASGTRTFGTLSVSGGSGSAFLHSVGGGNTNVTGAANLASSGNPIEIQNAANGSTVSFAATTISKTTAGGAGVNWGGTNTGATLSFASLALTTSNGSGLVAAGGGTINVTTGTISSTGGAAQAAPAINANGVTFGATFTSVSSTNSGSGGNGISLTNVLGTLTMSGGAISGAAGDAFLVSGGTANITYNGTVSTSAARPVNVASKTGGAVNFGGAISSTSNGVLLNANGGATINFTGGLSLSTGANIAFSATAGGTVNVCDESPCNPGATGALVNTLTTTSGTALNVANTNIGSNNLEFRSINVNGATRGIILNTTGSGGGLRVVGTGTTAGSGGTIQNVSQRGGEFTSTSNLLLRNMNFTNANTADAGGLGVCDDTTTTGCNAAIYLSSTTTVALERININGTIAEEGINGNNVNGFALSDSTIGASGQPCGDAVEEGCIKMRQWSGTSSITNSTLHFAAEDVMEILNQSGTLTLTVTSSNFRDTQFSASGSTGIIARSRGTGNMILNIVNSNFLRLRSNAFNATAQDNANLDVDINGSTFDSEAGIGIGVVLASDNTADMVFNIQNNPRIWSRNGIAVSVLGDGTSTFIGRIQNNPSIQVQAGSGTGIGTQVNNNATGVVQISGNTVVNVPVDAGITAIALGKTNPNPGGTLNATITGNNVTISDLATNNIETRSGSGSVGETNQPVCVNVANNVIGDPTPGGQPYGGIFTWRARVANANPNAQLDVQNFNTNIATTWANNGNTPNAGTSQSIAGGGRPISTCTTTLPSNPALNGPTGIDPRVALRLEPSGDDDASSFAQPSLTQLASADITAQPFVVLPQQQAQAVKIVNKVQESQKTNGSTANAPDAQSGAKESASKPPVVEPLVANFPITIGTLGANKSVTITFSAMVNNPLASSVTQIRNQGTVSGSNFTSFQTDDPDVANTAADPTITNVIPQPTITINNASAPEPASGSSNMPFTVALSGTYTVPVMVNFATADGSAIAGTDYTSTSGTVTFNVGETLQTISVPVLSDGDAGESDETFTVTLSSPVSATINGSGIATGTITAANPAGTVLISELRTSGPNGTNDDFVELYNNTNATVDISGWAIFKSGATCAATPILVGVIPGVVGSATTTIPARGHYLITGSAYSLGAVAAGNLTLLAAADIEADRNVALFNTANVVNLSTATRRDAVGFATNTDGNCALLREGTNLAAASGSVSQYSFARNLTSGTPRDNNNNATDFVLVSTTPATPVGDNLTPTLGAPGPENLASPFQRNAVIKAGLIDPTVLSTASPNRIRSGAGANPTNAAFGTLDIRRRFTNSTGATVTALRFRVTDITTRAGSAPPPVGTADLRLLTSANTTANGGTIIITGTTLDAPAQPNGGGLNSSVTVALPGGGLANGASINVRFLLGVQTEGIFGIFVNVEAIPGPPGVPNNPSPARKGTTGKQPSADAGEVEQPQP